MSRRRPRRCTGLYTCQCESCEHERQERAQRIIDGAHEHYRKGFPWENELGDRDGLRARRYRS